MISKIKNFFMFSFFLSLFFWIIVRIPDMIYSLIDSFGYNEKVIKGMIDILIAIAAIVFSSDNFCKKYLLFCNRKIHLSGEKTESFWSSLKVMGELIEAFPKRTFIFLIYIAVLTTAHLGWINNISDYTFIALFVIAADRIQSAWSTESQKILKHSKRALDEAIRFLK